MKLFLFFSVLFPLVAFAEPCGKEGSVEERIKNCNVTKENFVLVARDEKGAEFYKDLKTNLIWGSRITTDFNHYGSQKACSDDVSGYSVLSSLKWRLPTIREFETAAQNGMKKALPQMEHSYWSSTGVKVKRKYRRRRAQPALVYLWDGYEERTDTGDLKDAASVRCVAKE